jgi:threonine aldolase
MTLGNTDKKTPSPVYLWGDSDRIAPKDLIARLVKYENDKGIEQDTYSLGGIIETLELEMASLLGKEAAIFMPTGTLANHLVLRHLCVTQQRVIIPEQSHIYNDTGDGLEKLSGIKLLPLGKNKAGFSITEFKSAVRKSQEGRVPTPIGALVIESPVRRKQGAVIAFDDMKTITDYARSQGIASHLDGARIFMMSAATGIPIKNYTALFDTVYVSMYKYLNAPAGAILAGPSDLMESMVGTRRMFGGALAGTYLYGALALEALQDFPENYAVAFQKATDLFAQLNTLNGIDIHALENGSNIFSLRLSDNIDYDTFHHQLNGAEVFLNPNPVPPNALTIAVNTSILRQTNDEMTATFENALKKAIAT